MKKALHRNGLVAQFAYAVQIVVMLFYPALALAGPDDPNVIIGDAAVTQPDANTTLIQQGSDSAIINWRGFSIDVNELVKFEGGKATLNRVTGGDPSSIMGQLIADHRIFIVNQNGVVFGPDSHVDVAGLVATTFNIENDSFMNGTMSFTQDPSAQLAAIVNQGEIRVSDNGFVFLVAPSVSNEGLIIANLGQVVLGAGTSMTLDFNGDGLVTYQVDGKVLDRVVSPDGTTMRDAVANKGTIKADGGSVLLHADAADSVFDSLVNNSGVIQAQSLENRGGTVVLEGNSSAEFNGIGWQNNLGQVEATDGVVLNTGEIDVAAIEAGAQGGTVVLSGAYVGVSGDINAQGGGNVLVASSMKTILTSSASIDVSGQGSGDAGSAVVWSDRTTRFFGAILGRGGETGGDGASVEVSGYGHLDYHGAVDLSAPGGTWGTLLLDPAIVDLQGGAGDGDLDLPADGPAEFEGDPLIDGIATGAVGTVTAADVSPTTIFVSELEGTVAAVISIEASTSITDTAGLDNVADLGARNIILQVTGAGGAGVITLDDIAINTTGSITIQGSSGGVNPTNITVAESLTAGAGGITVDTNLGTVTFGTGTAMTVTSAGALTVNATGAIDDLANVNFAITGNATFNNAGGGNITIGDDAGTTANFGSLTFNGGASVIFIQDSNMVLAGASVATDEVNLTSTTGSIDDGGAATLTLGTDQAGDSEAFFGAVTTITLDNAGHAFDTVRVNGTTVTLNESTSATAFNGASTATALSVTAAGTITDAVGASLAVTGNATFNAGANAITLDNAAANNFGTLTFTSTGAVTIVENSGTNLLGASTADSLSLTANGIIQDDAGATLAVTNNATFIAGANAITLNNAAANNFGTLTFTSTGAVTIVENSGTNLLGASTADSLSLTANGIIQDDAGATLVVTNNATFNSGANAITLNNAGANTYGTLTFTSTGAVTIVENNATTFAGVSTADSLILTSTAGITGNAGTSLTVTNNANLSGTSITLAAAETYNFGSLTFNSAGAVSINEDSDTVLSGVSTANSLALTSFATISDDNTANLTVTNNASFTAGGSITLNDVYSFGTLTFNSAAALVTIVEADATVLAGVSTAGILALTSLGSITGSGVGTTSVTVGLAASFTGTSITLAAADTYNFGTLTFNSAGAVSISEDSDTVLTGVSTADSLVLSSTASLTNDAFANLTVTNNASFSGTSIDLNVTTAAVAMNFGTLTFNSAGAVSISESSATVLAGVSTADSLALTSAAGITGVGANVTVTNNASFSGTSITLAAADTYNFGSLTVNSAGAVSVFEDSDTVLSGVSVVDSLVLNSAGAISGAALTSLTVTNNASFTAVTTITLAAAETYNFGNLTFAGTVVAITEDSTMALTNGSTATTSAVLTTTLGDITDFAADGNGIAGSENVTSLQIFFNSAGSVGALAESIEINATEMEAAAAAVGGNVFVRDVAGGLDLDDWSTVDGTSVTGGGAATITALSPLTVSANVLMVGAVLLQADDSTVDVGLPGTDNITVNTGITVQSTGSSVSLQAGDSIDLQGTAALTAATFVSLTADALVLTNSDAFGGITQGVGSVITAPDLAIRSADSVTLDQSNDVTNLAATVTTAGATLTFYDATGIGDVVRPNLNIAGVAIDGLTGVASSNGVITLRMDNLSFGSTINSGTARTILEPFTAAQPIDLGLVVETAAALALSDAELDLVTASVLQIGRTDQSNTGNINISAAISQPAGWNTLALINGGTITEGGAGSLNPVTNLRVTSTGAVTIGNTTNDVTNLAADVTGVGNAFFYQDANALTVTTVDGVSGIATTGGAITIVANGLLTIADTGDAEDVTTDRLGTGAVADIIYRADDLTLAGTTVADPLFATNFIWLMPFDADVDIELGVNVTAGVFTVDAAELGTLSANVLRIGYRLGLGATAFNPNPNPSDDITVTAAIASTGIPILSLLTGSAANGGTISQAAGATITWPQLRLEAHGSMALDEANDADFLAAQVFTKGSNIDFTDVDELGIAAGPTVVAPGPPLVNGAIDTLNAVTTQVGAGAGDGNVQIIATNDLTVLNSVLACDVNTGTGNSDLQSTTANVIVNNGANVCSGAVTVSAADDVVLNDPIHADISITINAGTDGTGSIIDPAADDVGTVGVLDLDSPIIRLFAGNGIGDPAFGSSTIETSGGVLTARAGFFGGGTGLGSVFIRDNSTFTDENGAGATENPTAGLTLALVTTTDGQIDIFVENGDLNVQAPTLAGAFLGVRDFGADANDADLSGDGDVTFRSFGALRLGTNGTADAGGLTGTAFTFSGLADVEAADLISLTSGVTPAGGLVVGAIVDGDIALVDVSTGGSGNRVNVLAPRLFMRGSTGVGTQNNHIEGSTSFLDLEFDSGGGAYDNFVAGLLTVMDINGNLRGGRITDAAGFGTGETFVRNHSPINFAVDYTAAGSQTYIADESDGAGDNFTLLDTFSIESTAGSVFIKAGDNIVIGDVVGGADTFVSGVGTVELTSSLLGNGGASADQDGIGTVTIRGVLGFGGASTATRVNVKANGAIDMFDGANLGTITTIATGTVELNANNDGVAGGLVDLGTVTTRDLTVTANGTISDDGAGAVITATRNTTLTTDPTFSITLDNAANDFGTVNVTNADDVTIADASALVLGSIVAADDVTLTVVGAITDGNNGATNVTGDLLTITAGADGFGIAANAVETVVNTVAAPGIDAGGFFMKNTGDLTISGIVMTVAGDVNVEAASDMTIAATIDAAGGNVTLTASESILSTVAAGTLDILNALTATLVAGGGAGSIGAGAAAGIIETDATTLVLNASGAGNIVVTEFDGATVTATTGSGNITLVSTTGGFDFAGASTTGALSVTAIGAAGGITDTGAGALVIGGTTTLNAGANDIALDTATNDFSRVTITGATNATLVDRNAIDLGATGAVLTTLSVSASGNITQSGALTATTATFAAGAGGNVSLTNAANDFDTASVTSGLTVNVNDVDDLIVGASASSGNFTVTSGGALTLGLVTAGGAGVGDGNIIATATTGDLTFDDLTAAGDRVTLTSVAGSVNEDGDGGVDVTAGGFVASGATGVGTTDPIESNVRFFEAAGGTGGIALANAGALTVGGIGALASMVATGTIDISAASPLTVATNMITAGAIVLTAGGDTAALGDNLTLNLGVVVQSTTSTVTLSAGDDVVFGGVINAATATIVAAGVADAGDGGSVVNANGTLTDVTAISLTVSAVGGTAANGIDLDTAIAALTAAGVTGVGGIDVSDIGGGLLALTATTFDGGIAISGTGGAMVATTVAAGGTGGITLNNVGGATTLTLGTTDNGDIVVNGNGGLVTLTTAIAGGTGSIEASSLAGGLTIGTAITGNGDIVANGNGGAVDLATGALDVLVAGGTGSILASSTGGTLTIGTAITTDGDIVANGNGGAVVLGTGLGALVAGINGEISVSSVGGALTLGTAVTTNGDITANANGGTLTLTALTAGGSGDIVGVGTADISIDVLAAALTVSLTAGTTINETGDAGVDITAVSASLSSGTGIGTTGSIEVDLTTLTSALVTGAGLIDVNDVAGGLNVLSAVTMGGGAITLAAAGGDLGLGTVNASAGASAVSVTSTTGAITDLNGGDTNVTTSGLTASAATGIDLDTATPTLTSVTVLGVGAINIENVGDLAVTLATTAAGSIEISTVGAMDVTTVTAVGAGNDVFLTATGIDADLTLTGLVTAPDVVTLTADGSIVDDADAGANDVAAASLVALAEEGVGILGNEIETTVTNLEGNGGAGGFFLTNTGALTVGGVTDGVVGIGAQGEIQVIAASPLTVNETVASAGDVLLQANEGGNNANLDQLTINANVTGHNITLNSGDDVIINDTVEAQENLAINAGDGVFINDFIFAGELVTITTGGAVFGADDTAVTCPNVLSMGPGGGIFADDIVITVFGDITLGILKAVDTVTVTALDDPVTLAEEGTISLGDGGLVQGKIVAGMSVTLNADVSILFVQSVTAPGDPDAFINAGSRLTMTADANLNGTGLIADTEADALTVADILAPVVIATAATGIAYDGQVDSLVNAATTTGAVTITDIDDLVVGTVTTNAAGTVTLTTGGAIIDANGAGTNNVTGLNLIATTGAGVNLDTTITGGGTLTATVSGDGDIDIRNTSGGALTLTAGTVAGSGDVTVTHDDNLTSTLATAANGDVTLTAALDIASTTATSGQGNVNLTAGDDLTSTTATSAQGNVTLTAATTLASVTATSGNGNVDLTAGTTLASTTATSANGNVGLTAGTTLASTTATSANGNVGLTAGTTLASTTASSADGNVDLTAGTTLTSTTVTATDGTANLTAGTTLASTTVTTTNGNANLTAGTTLASTTVTATNGTANLTAGTTLASTTVTTTDGNANLTAGTDLAATTVTATNGGANLTAGGTLTSGAVTTTNGDAVQTAGGALTNTTTTTTNGDAIFTGTSVALTTVTAGGAGVGDGSIIATATATDVTFNTLSALGDTVTLTAGDDINEDGDAGVDVLAAGFVARAAQADASGSVGGASSIETAVANLEGVSGTDGFAVNNAGAMTIGGISETFGVFSTGAVIISTASPMNVNEDVVGASVALTALGAVADAPGFNDDINIASGVVVQATTTTVTLSAEDDINNGGTVVAVTTATLTAGAGDSGDAAGSITDTNGDGVNINAPTVVLAAFGNNVAGSAIDVDTTATTVTSATVATGTGGIDIADSAGGLTVTTTTTTSGDISVEAIGGDLLVTTATAGGDDSDITLTTTTAGNLTVGILTAADDRVTLDSTGNVNDTDAGTAVTSNELVAIGDTGVGTADTLNTEVEDVEGAGGTGVFNLTNLGDLGVGIDVNSSVEGISADGAITLTTAAGGVSADPDLNIDVIENVTGGASVTMTAGEVAANGSADDISLVQFKTIEAATTLTLTAGDDIVDAGLLVAGTTATLTAGAVAGADADGGSIVDLNDTQENLIATTLVASAFGNDAPANGLSIDLDTRVTTVTSATVGAAGNGTIEAGGIRIEDTQFGVTVNNSTTELGDITLSATGGDLAIGGTGVTASSGGGVGNIVLNTFTGMGATGPETSGNITLGVAAATTLTAAGDLVELNSVGNVTDAQADGSGEAGVVNNITSADLLVRARNGFGTAAERIETTVTRVAGNFDQIGWFQTDLAGGLIIGNVTSLDGSVVSGVTETDLTNDGLATADITIQALSPIFVLANVLAAGDILLIADEVVGAGDNLTVTSLEDVNFNGILDAGEDANGNGVLDNVTVQSTLGDVELQAGDNVVTGTGAVVSAFDDLTIRAGFDADEGDLDGIGAATLLGTHTSEIGTTTVTALETITLGLFIAADGLILFTEFGNILDGNGDALNIQANGLSTFTAVRGVIGIETDAIEIEVQNGQVVANAGASSDRVSVNLNGDIEPDGRFFSSVAAPGLELFNNRVLGGDGIDEVTDRFFKYTSDRQIRNSGELDHATPGFYTMLMFYIGDDVVNPEALYQWDASLEGSMGGGK